VVRWTPACSARSACDKAARKRISLSRLNRGMARPIVTGVLPVVRNGVLGGSSIGNAIDIL
jgi:hypothetical protein